MIIDSFDVPKPKKRRDPYARELPKKRGGPLKDRRTKREKRRWKRIDLEEEA